MHDSSMNESMMELFLFESTQQIDQLEQLIIKNEKAIGFDIDSINEIFRIMHTIKGSSSMMMLENIALLSHALEDLFVLIRENQSSVSEHSNIIDIFLESVDFIKVELLKLNAGNDCDGDASPYVKKVRELISRFKHCDKKPEAALVQQEKREQKQQDCIGYACNDQEKNCAFKATIFFEDDCQMENIRAFGIVHSLKEAAYDIVHIPEDIINDEAAEYIRKKGFEICFNSYLEYEDIKSILMQAIFVKNFELEKKNPTGTFAKANNVIESEKIKNNSTHAAMISVNVHKLDKLMDLVGELMISGLMVTQNPLLKGAQFADFKKSAALHTKIIGELQDISMSLRMVPISATFNKINRIVRDISKKLDKEIRLDIIGEETEIDKNIVESISDPLMHLVRNSADHGVEEKDDRIALGKNTTASIRLEAKNIGGEVWIIVKDDGRGLDMEKIYKKAYENGLVFKDLSEMTENEVYSLIFKPGFSTKENVTEFSGRGVGLDVVVKNISNIGGSVSVASKKGVGTTFTIKIPLTLAIIGGITVRVGDMVYTIPTMSIRECFRPTQKGILIDPDGNEMIMIRGECYSIVRIHKIFNVDTIVKAFWDGILIMVENEKSRYCIFVDELIGEQQIVVKALPNYINKKIRGVSGCTLLGDGSISLIIDLESIK